MTANQPAKNHPWRKAAPAWSHNVQLIRLWMPAQQDTDHHKSLIAFDKDLEKLLLKHFGKSSFPSYIGFYRANADWDNIDTPTSCIASPNRGARDSEIDNEP
jgi:hypothetical protein